MKISQLPVRTVKWLVAHGFEESGLITDDTTDYSAIDNTSFTFSPKSPTHFDSALECAVYFRNHEVFVDLVPHHPLDEEQIAALFYDAINAHQNKLPNLYFLLKHFEVTEAIVASAEKQLRRDCCASVMYKFSNIFTYQPWDENAEIMKCLNDALDKTSPSHVGKMKKN